MIFFTDSFSSYHRPQKLENWMQRENNLCFQFQIRRTKDKKTMISLFDVLSYIKNYFLHKFEVILKHLAKKLQKLQK